MTSWKKIKKLLRKMVFPTVIVLVVVFILFVLWKTSRDPSKEIVHKYERIPSIHTEKTSFHYGIVIDCGSSGSRIFIYYWPPHDGNPHKLLKLNQMMDHDNRPVRMKIKPGITFCDKHALVNCIYRTPKPQHTERYPELFPKS